jgi:hypothetical protein
MESHRRLLWRPSPARRSVDGIVVPTVRPVRDELLGLDLAAAMECPVVAFCTGAARAADVMARADDMAMPGVTAVDLPPDYDHPLVRFSTSDDYAAVAPHFYDLSLKRNLGLLLARLAGWRTVLFLDDDVEGLTADRVGEAAGLLAYTSAAAFAMVRYPDHSVVYHASHLAGDSREVFVSGGACLLNLPRIDSFFPAVYNEDWLFLLDALHGGHVAYAGDVEQLPYDPFGDPERARAEEFGDVLAEGLMALSRRGGWLGEADGRYWAWFLRRRAEFIEWARSRISEAAIQEPLAGRVLMSLAAAERRRSAIEPRDLLEYIAAWREDLCQWRKRLDLLPRPHSMEFALEKLGLFRAALTTSAQSAVSLWQS